MALHHSVYPEDCLTEACEAFKGFAEVSVQRGEGCARISIAPLSSASDLLLLRREFLNYVLDLCIKNHLAR